MGGPPSREQQMITPDDNWKLLVQGKVVMDQPRHVVLVD